MSDDGKQEARESLANKSSRLPEIQGQVVGWVPQDSLPERVSHACLFPLERPVTPANLLVDDGPGGPKHTPQPEGEFRALRAMYVSDAVWSGPGRSIKPAWQPACLVLLFFLFFSSIFLSCFLFHSQAYSPDGCCLGGKSNPRQALNNPISSGIPCEKELYGTARTALSKHRLGATRPSQAGPRGRDHQCG